MSLSSCSCFHGGTSSVPGLVELIDCYDSMAQKTHQ